MLVRASSGSGGGGATRTPTHTTIALTNNVFVDTGVKATDIVQMCGHNGVSSSQRFLSYFEDGVLDTSVGYANYIVVQVGSNGNVELKATYASGNYDIWYI